MFLSWAWLAKLAWLAWIEAKRQPLALIALATLTALGTGILSALALAGSFAGSSTKQLLHSAAIEQVLVVQPRQPADRNQVMSFERRQLSPSTLDALRKLPGCLSCDVLHAVPVPATLRIRMAGLLDNDQFIGVFALNGDLVPQELHEQWQRTDGPIPIILNPQVIPLFNIALAERYHLPQISPRILLGAGVTFEFGRDRFMSLPKYLSLPARFVGYHPLVPLWGIAIPHHRAEELLPQVSATRPAGAGPIEAHLRFCLARCLTSSTERN